MQGWSRSGMGMPQKWARVGKQSYCDRQIFIFCTVPIKIINANITMRDQMYVK